MQWFELVYKPIPNQGLSGSFSLYVKAENEAAAKKAGETELAEMHARPFDTVDRHGKKFVRVIRWSLHDVKPYEGE